jgi:hypothetical protein
VSQAIQSFGTFLKTDDGAGNFTTIAEVMNINGLQMSAKVDDTTTHSTGVPWRTKIATLLDAGTITFDINFIPTEATHSFSAGLLQPDEAQFQTGVPGRRIDHLGLLRLLPGLQAHRARRRRAEGGHHDRRERTAHSPRINRPCATPYRSPWAARSGRSPSI